MTSLRNQNGNVAHVYDVRSHGVNVRSEFHSPNLGNENCKYFIDTVEIVNKYINNEIIAKEV